MGPTGVLVEVDGLQARRHTHSYHPNQGGENAMGVLAAYVIGTLEDVLPPATWVHRSQHRSRCWPDG